ncbi:MAG TPA: prepilin-type N-terminal cleavage/methylation domain-containing protein [Candidatus Saccharimonadales bacterium]|nr:prepilin-type N-terminal cleavage/methylation domain-containing protein [Candidatus Saccharimonadales bacterium]
MNKQAGYTLIELLLVISLLSLAVGVSTDIILTLVRSYTKTQVTNEIEQNSNFVFLKLEKELRNAQTVSSVSANSISFQDSTGATITYAIVSAGSGILTIQRNGSTLTNTDSVNGVTITCTGSASSCFLQVGASPTVIEIDMSFKQVNSPGAAFTGSVDLNDTIVVRGTY